MAEKAKNGLNKQKGLMSYNELNKSTKLNGINQQNESGQVRHCWEYG